MSRHSPTAQSNYAESSIDIEPRNVTFDYNAIEKSDFFDGNIVSSAFFVALSVTFPPGEAEFIKSVRLFDKEIDSPKLKQQVKDFAAQEAHHGLQHKLLNKRFSELGYDVKRLTDAINIKLSERVINWSPAARLRRTVSAEHFTATMATQLLAAPETLDQAPEVFKNLMIWHAIEEVEHKAVAFDVYESCVGNMRALRWHYLHFSLVEFPLTYWLATRFLLKQGGFKVTWRARKEFLLVLFGKKGIYSTMFGFYAKFLKKSFHPWQQDDSSLIEPWKTKLTPFFN